MKKSIKYIVYRIVDDDKTIYIGYTSNLYRRTQQHKYNINRLVHRDFYKYLFTRGIKEVYLEPIEEFNSKVEAKRYEIMIQLLYHFSGHKTLNRIPSICD